jgi:hypothetical protein
MMQPSWPGLSLVKRAGFIFMTLRQRIILPMEKSKLTKIKKAETDEEQSQEHADQFL